MNDNLAYELEFWDELIDGEIVLMSPRPATNHNQTAFNIAALFKTFLKGKTCRVFPDGMDLYLTEKDRFVPDVMVICDRSKIKNDGIHGAPDLVVKSSPPPPSSGTEFTKNAFTSSAAYGNTGLSIRWTKRWRSICWQTTPSSCPKSTASRRTTGGTGRRRRIKRKSTRRLPRPSSPV